MEVISAVLMGYVIIMVVIMIWAGILAAGAMALAILGLAIFHGAEYVRKQYRDCWNRRQPVSAQKPGGQE